MLARSIVSRLLYVVSIMLHLLVRLRIVMLFCTVFPVLVLCALCARCRQPEHMLRFWYLVLHCLLWCWCPQPPAASTSAVSADKEKTDEQRYNRLSDEAKDTLKKIVYRGQVFRIGCTLS